MDGCKYEHVFIRQFDKDIRVPCVKENGHDGNHVVIEPTGKKPLEVPRRSA